MKTLTTSYSLIQLRNSPIEFAKIISCVCYGFKYRQSNILDIYLILPLLLYEAGISNLKNATIRSSIQSVYLKNNIIGIAGLQSRIDKLKQKTIDSFIIAINMNLIAMDEESFDIKVTSYGKKQAVRFKKDNKRFCKEAINLGKILSKNDVKENYRLLGVKRI
ncbi:MULTISPECIES: three component ABC system middle component [unclassified Clostridium]|uniref:three component ABC system middle component n=1 Tax=unclassified Clostridium TaxID=2614128 RepID=UPI00207AAB6A|nr:MULTISPECIES: three component ABC system middle component [unclassified Clostridium]